MIEVSVTCEAGARHARFLERNLRAAGRSLPAAPAVVSLAVVGKQRMAALHERFLGKAGPTDVLSFELEHDAAGRVSDGEIVICLPVAAAEAKRRGHAVEHELLLYALHGLLHLSGYDDVNESDWAAMHAREDEILDELGIGAVFARRLRGRR